MGRWGRRDGERALWEVATYMFPKLRQHLCSACHQWGTAEPQSLSFLCYVKINGQLGSCSQH